MAEIDKDTAERIQQERDARIRAIIGDALDYVNAVYDDEVTEIEAELELKRSRSITFDMLAKLSEEFGTKLIDLHTTPERYFSEVTGADPAEIRLVIRGATK